MIQNSRSNIVKKAVILQKYNILDILSYIIMICLHYQKYVLFNFLIKIFTKSLKVRCSIVIIGVLTGKYFSFIRLFSASICLNIFLISSSDNLSVLLSIKQVLFYYLNQYYDNHS